MRMSRLAMLAVVLAVTACGGVGTVAPSTTTTTAPSTTIGSTVPPTDPIAAVTEAAKADLARRLGVEESEIGVTSAAAVTWPNGALGCPQPGMAYTQALVDGHQVVLEVGGRYFAYHAGSDAVPFLCHSIAEDGGHSTPPAPPGTTS